MTAAATKRLQKEYQTILKDPTPLVRAVPDKNNILHCHFLFFFPNNHDSPYAGGVYHGKLVFPKNYPMAPPSIMIMTPTGRFKVCFVSISSRPRFLTALLQAVT
jgi:ubiquitin-conjugating enzyme E2 J2